MKTKFKNEKRTRIAEDVEFRFDEEKDVMNVEGYALKFNKQTLIGSEENGFREQIAIGSLENADMRKVPLKYNHNSGYLALASTKNGSLELEVDDVGLRFKAKLLDISAHKDVYEMIRSGLLSECSFAFTTDLEDGTEWDFDVKPPVRTIKKISRLFDVSIVDLGAYPDTELYARSFDELENHRETVEAERAKKESIKRSINIKLKLGGELE
ncbi:MAG: HK97 family phage prohead protease [Bacteroidales bacterium]|nr:HK97 family phage prohead protease [Bacteroidales bacterium]